MPYPLSPSNFPSAIVHGRSCRACFTIIHGRTDGTVLAAVSASFTGTHHRCSLKPPELTKPVIPLLGPFFNSTIPCNVSLKPSILAYARRARRCCRLGAASLLPVSSNISELSGCNDISEVRLLLLRVKGERGVIAV
ncbi:hypothetical protein PIB30_090877 [Stylosanthes scabra]|uniref:Uncharacterized protein n=1 Tax=Stylosanthes scabra TaxID=79078 RepID=A0ABU6VSW4_9FABA|nr:hypothetical protein [Stylosanthes scabra]